MSSQTQCSLLLETSFSDLIISHYSDSLKYIVSENSLRPWMKCHTSRSSSIRHCFAINMTFITQIYLFIYFYWQCVLSFIFLQHYRQLWSAGNHFGYVQRGRIMGIHPAIASLYVNSVHLYLWVPRFTMGLWVHKCKKLFANPSDDFNITVAYVKEYLAAQVLDRIILL